MRPYKLIRACDVHCVRLLPPIYLVPPPRSDDSYLGFSPYPILQTDVLDNSFVRQSLFIQYGSRPMVIFVRDPGIFEKICGLPISCNPYAHTSNYLSPFNQTRPYPRCSRSLRHSKEVPTPKVNTFQYSHP